MIGVDLTGRSRETGAMVGPASACMRSTTIRTAGGGRERYGLNSYFKFLAMFQPIF